MHKCQECPLKGSCELEGVVAAIKKEFGQDAELKGVVFSPMTFLMPHTVIVVLPEEMVAPIRTLMLSGETEFSPENEHFEKIEAAAKRAFGEESQAASGILISKTPDILSFGIFTVSTKRLLELISEDADADGGEQEE